jgi:hypothetical protein
MVDVMVSKMSEGRFYRRVPVRGKPSERACIDTVQQSELSVVV